MAVVILKDVNRMPGFNVSGSILAGQVVKLSDQYTVQSYSWNGAGTAPEVLGLALESTESVVVANIPTYKWLDSRSLVDPLARPVSDKPTGDISAVGTFYDQVDRGNQVSVAFGGEFSLYNDGRGDVYMTADSFVLDGKVYVDNITGLATADAVDGLTNANKQIGVCLQVPVAVTSPVLKIKLTI